MTHEWRTKTGIRDGSPSGRFVVDWTEAEEALDEARAEPRAEGLDVERLARALTGVWTYSEPFSAMQDADKLAREYAALEEPTP